MTGKQAKAIQSFLQEKIIEALESVVPERIENDFADNDAKMAQNPRIAEMLGKQAGFNACRKEILSNIEKFKQ